MVDDVRVTGRDDSDPGEVEFLDIGPPDPPADGNRPAPRRWRWWYALVAAAVLVTVVVVASVNKGAKHHTAAPSQPPSTAHSEPPPPTSLAPSSEPTAQTITVTDAGHSLLDVPRDWELFGRGTYEVVRIELARGRITRTPSPGVSTGGGVSFVAGPDRVIVRPLDDVPGYQVVDGHPAQKLRSTLGQGGAAVPGPKSNQLWMPTGNDTHRSMVLVGFDGRPAGRTIPIPPDVGFVSSDGAGYLLFYGTGGMYDVRPDGTRRVTGGDLLAVGPTKWLTYDCDDRYRCSTVVIDRASGARHLLNTEAGDRGSTGVISPDGSTAALIRVSENAAATVRLLNLATGVYRATGVSFDPGSGFDGGAVVWSPDSRWLFMATVQGLRVLDPHTMRFADLHVSLPLVTQLALRTGAG